MQWVLIIMLWGEANSNPTMTGVSGFLTHAACVDAGEAWKKSKHELERDYECLPASEK